MKIYVTFDENGIQTGMMRQPQSPGANWHEADGSGTHVLENGVVRLLSEDEVEQLKQKRKRADKLSEHKQAIADNHDALLLKMLENPTAVDRDAWPDQRADAAAFMADADDASVHADIDARLKAGETREEWATKVHSVKVPFGKFCAAVAAGVKRKAEQRAEDFEQAGYTAEWRDQLDEVIALDWADADAAQTAAKAELAKLSGAAS